jgi:hypothetical protein
MHHSSCVRRMVGFLVAAIALAATASAIALAATASEPAWVQKMIKDIQYAPVTNPPSSLYHCQFKGDSYYYRPGRHFHVPGELYKDKAFSASSRYRDYLICYTYGDPGGRLRITCKPSKASMWELVRGLEQEHSLDHLCTLIWEDVRR